MPELFKRRRDNEWTKTDRAERLKNLTVVLLFGGAFLGGMIFLAVALFE